MKQKHRRKPKRYRELALTHIFRLFEIAEKEFPSRPELSFRYVQLARKIAMKFKVSIPKHLKRRFCKHCHAYLVPGNNCRVRVSAGKVIYFCEECRRFMRFPTKNKN